jgi:hypothetical protein
LSLCSVNTPATRIFDVNVEGTVIQNIDVVQIAGARTAVTRELGNVVVVDGFLTIELLTNVPFSGNPTITGIEVERMGPVPASPVASPAISPVASPPSAPTPAFQPILINCGGDEYRDTQGRLWRADAYSDGGNTFGTTLEIQGTSDDTVYRSERWGEFTYSIPIPEGDYAVILHFAEIK